MANTPDGLKQKHDQSEAWRPAGTEEFKSRLAELPQAYKKVMLELEAEAVGNRARLDQSGGPDCMSMCMCIGMISSGQNRIQSHVKA